MSENRTQEIDIEKIMERIREQIRQRREKSVLQEVPIETSTPKMREQGDIDIDLTQVRSILASAEGRTDIGQLTPMVQFRKPVRVLARLVGKLVVYLSSFITDRQSLLNKNFLYTLHLLTNNLEKTAQSLRHYGETIETNIQNFGSKIAQINNSLGDLQGVRTELQDLNSQSQKETQELHTKIDSMKGTFMEDLKGLRTELLDLNSQSQKETRELHTQIDSLRSIFLEDLTGLRTELHDLNSQSQKESRELHTQIDSLRGTFLDDLKGIGTEIQDLNSKIGRLTNDVDHVKTEHDLFRSNVPDIQRVSEIEREIADFARQIRNLKLNLLDQERRLTLFLREAKRRLPGPVSSDQIQETLKEEDHILDAFYVSFEDQFRGTREDIKGRLMAYLPYLERMDTVARILDLGCGRGEWLELLREHKFSGLGIDINRVMADTCKELGLDVVVSDAIDYLRTLKSNSAGLITAFHLIEHLPQKTLIMLLDEIVRVLKPGGISIMETPNPQNVLVGSYSFYFDPTHLNPLPSPLMKFLLEARGLSSIEILNLHPYPKDMWMNGSDLATRFNEYFYGPQDYAVIGWKV